MGEALGRASGQWKIKGWALKKALNKGGRRGRGELGEKHWRRSGAGVQGQTAEGEGRKRKGE